MDSLISLGSFPGGERGKKEAEVAVGVRFVKPERTVLEAKKSGRGIRQTGGVGGAARTIFGLLCTRLFEALV